MSCHQSGDAGEINERCRRSLVPWRLLECQKMPRFVVLEHTWNGVHWDFMLEAGEVLRTWAIDAADRPRP